MFDFLVLNDTNDRHRLVACVNWLGEAKRLTVVDDRKLELETEEGRWTLDRRAFNPAFGASGFVGVELPSLKDKMALYFDLRIVAALVKAKIRWADTDQNFEFTKEREIPLFSREESLEIVRTEMVGDFWSLMMIANDITWVDGEGKPIPVEDDFDVNKMVGFDAMRVSACEVAECDKELWLLCMLTKPDGEERRNVECDYRVKRMATFLSARYAHYHALHAFLGGQDFIGGQ